MVEIATATPFLAECFWPDVREDEVEAASERLRAQVSLSVEVGGGVGLSYAGSILVPQDEVVFFLFRAASPDAVREVCLRARVPLERVMAVASTVVPPYGPMAAPDVRRQPGAAGDGSG